MEFSASAGQYKKQSMEWTEPGNFKKNHGNYLRKTSCPFLGHFSKKDNLLYLMIMNANSLG
jgi:hypothetical protein